MLMKIAGARIWAFRVLVVLAAGFFVTVFLLPWWNLDVLNEGTTVIAVKNAYTIYSYGAHTNLVKYIIYAEPYLTPLYQKVVVFILFGVSVILMLFSTWLKGRKGRLLLGILGLVYTLYPVGTYILISRTAHSKNLLLVGTTPIQGASLVTSFMPAYYVAYAAGAVLILLALLRPVIAPALKAGK
jgi:hypothetical protein